MAALSRRVFWWSLGFLLLIPFGVGPNTAGMAVTTLFRGAFGTLPMLIIIVALPLVGLEGSVLLWSALRGLKRSVRIAEWAGRNKLFHIEHPDPSRFADGAS